MKFTCSLTDEDGFTVSLSFSTLESCQEPSLQVSKGPFASHSLASSAFVQSLPQLSAQLEQVYLSSGVILASSLSKALKEEGDELAKEES
jgi:hypothetical protein